MSHQQAHVGMGIAQFERYIRVVEALHRPTEEQASTLLKSDNLELQLMHGYRVLRSVLELCGGGLRRATGNRISLNSSWEDYVVTVHDGAYLASRTAERDYSPLVMQFTPNPLLSANVLSRFGRPQGFLFGHLMDGVPISDLFTKKTSSIDFKRQEIRKNGIKGVV